MSALEPMARSLRSQGSPGAELRVGLGFRVYGKKHISKNKDRDIPYNPP